ncbi:unnamed protein product [Amoebophrya sp. A25]|nr:unnamed protein product [Amoebophrya sp. A25]|eukprot:GSA25T00016092001.1
MKVHNTTTSVADERRSIHALFPPWSLRENADLFDKAFPPSAETAQEQKADMASQVLPSDAVWDYTVGKYFLGSRWNEHPRSPAWYRSPWISATAREAWAKFYRAPYSFREKRIVPIHESETTADAAPPNEATTGIAVSDEVRRCETEFNQVFARYADEYYGKGTAVTSVFLWEPLLECRIQRPRPGAGGSGSLEPDEEVVLEGVLLLKKELVGDSSVGADKVSGGGKTLDHQKLGSATSGGARSEIKASSRTWDSVHRIRLSEICAKRLLHTHAAAVTTSVFRSWSTIIFVHNELPSSSSAESSEQKADATSDAISDESGRMKDAAQEIANREGLDSRRTRIIGPAKTCTGYSIDRHKEERHRFGMSGNESVVLLRQVVFGRMIEAAENEMREHLEFSLMHRHGDYFTDEFGPNGGGNPRDETKNNVYAELQAHLAKRAPRPEEAA